MKITQKEDGTLVIDADGDKIALSIEGVNPQNIRRLDFHGFADARIAEVPDVLEAAPH